MEAIVLILIIVILVLLFKRTFSSVIYATVLVDLFLRLVAFFCSQIKLVDSLPASFNAVIYNLTNGLLETILLWIIFAVYVLFFYYTLRIFIKKK